jgi:hypothetical protein
VTPLDITGARLRTQRLSAGRVETAADVVGWLGAVQAQEYADTKWAVALRMRRATDAAIEQAFAGGAILRTHVLRPTWHFVTPADIRWLLMLTGPRVSRAMAPYNRHLELDAAIFRRSQRAIVKALGGGRHLTRQELKAVLLRAGIQADGVQRLAHIVMQAELDAVVCSGPRRGTQQTYALLDERVPPSPARSRDDALAELARRYFTSHGPAQLHDFAWWSGLPVADARAGLAAVERDLARHVIDGRTYWGASSARASTRRRAAYLLPLYDEYLIAYRDRSAALDRSRWTRVTARHPFSAPIVLGGQVAGGWRRGLTGDPNLVTLMPFARMRTDDAAAVEEAARRYGRFIGREIDVSWE